VLTIDGILLLKIDEEFLLKMLPKEMKSAFKKRKFLRVIHLLNEHMVKFEKVCSQQNTMLLFVHFFSMQDTKLDEIDEYILTIESKRINVSLAYVQFYAIGFVLNTYTIAFMIIVGCKVEIII